MSTFKHYYSDTPRRPYPYSVWLSSRTFLDNGHEIENDVGTYYSLRRAYRWRNVKKDTNLPVRYRMILKGIGNEASWNTFLTMC